jgi:excisionase family DNA binding protein
MERVSNHSLFPFAGGNTMAFADISTQYFIADDVVTQGFVPVCAELTTEEAANVLGASEQFLIGLLDSGEIAFRQVGDKRLVKLDDLHAYKQEKKRLREQVLDEMAQDAQQWNMGY